MPPHWPCCSFHLAFFQVVQIPEFYVGLIFTSLLFKNQLPKPEEPCLSLIAAGDDKVHILGIPKKGFTLSLPSFSVENERRLKLIALASLGGPTQKERSIISQCNREIESIRFYDKRKLHVLTQHFL